MISSSYNVQYPSLIGKLLVQCSVPDGCWSPGTCVGLVLGGGVSRCSASAVTDYWAPLGTIAGVCNRSQHNDTEDCHLTLDTLTTTLELQTKLKRRFAKISQSQRRPLAPTRIFILLKAPPALSHLRHYAKQLNRHRREIRTPRQRS